jgi:hypothetical protein
MIHSFLLQQLSISHQQDIRSIAGETIISKVNPVSHKAYFVKETQKEIRKSAETSLI